MGDGAFGGDPSCGELGHALGPAQCNISASCTSAESIAARHEMGQCPISSFSTV